MLRWGKDKKDDKQKDRLEAAPKPPSPSAEKPLQDAAREAATASEPAVPSGMQTLEEVLIEAGQISQEQLRQAIERQKESGEFLGMILVDMGFIDENSLTSFLAKYCKIPHLSLLDYLIDESLIELVPQEVCLKHRLLPIDRLGKNLTVAMVNPLDRQALETVKSLFPSLRIKPILCAWNHYESVTKRLFGIQAEAREVTAEDLGLRKKPGVPPTPVAEPVAEPISEPAPEPVVESVPEEPPAPAVEEPIPEVAPEEPSIEGTEEAPVEAPAPPLILEPESPEAAKAHEAVLTDVFRETPEEEEAEEPAEPRPARRLRGVRGGASPLMQEMISVMRDSMRDTYAVLARRTELFRGLSPEMVAKIFAKGMTVEFEPGKTVFDKGAPGKELYAILGGKVRILDDGREIATLSRGDMFGEMALISNEPRSASAVTMETTSVLVLTYDVFDKVLPKEAALQLLVNIVITLSKRLRTANAVIHSLNKP